MEKESRPKMKILSWNINGIRAGKVNLKTLFDSLDSDVICIQETKVTRDQLDEPSAIVEGYNSYFSFSRKRSGYSGVATFCKNTAVPIKAEEGLTDLLNPKQDGKVGCYGNVSEFTDEELESLDAEGRSLITQHRIRKKNGEEADLAIINVYCPRADPEREDRQLYKLRFHALLQTRAEALLKNGYHVIVLGDINVSHKMIDFCDTTHGEFLRKPSRIWLNQFLWEHDRDPDIADVDNKEDFAGTTVHCKGGCFVDSFRYFYPDKEGAYTNWCTLTGARDTNYGRRLDYILTDVELSKSDLKNASIHPDVEGSDHCPVQVELYGSFITAEKFPVLCTKNMPEFTGKQQKLSMFFTKAEKIRNSY
ncbi:hypothetical protein KUTeg_020999 [Tegillarca granosa]|uniref:DNA-(apurinic or apyrimidinic site) endonuclease n=1 Tax=Tegillarca granosa TaxID=220873 RepID=A0ABQ9EDN6_TEGGR|nr:hypothetical protein KUTeg_020999 [Tegillarca granosa]